MEEAVAVAERLGRGIVLPHQVRAIVVVADAVLVRIGVVQSDGNRLVGGLGAARLVRQRIGTLLLDAPLAQVAVERRIEVGVDHRSLLQRPPHLVGREFHLCQRVAIEVVIDQQDLARVGDDLPLVVAAEDAVGSRDLIVAQRMQLRHEVARHVVTRLRILHAAEIARDVACDDRVGHDGARAELEGVSLDSQLVGIVYQRTADIVGRVVAGGQRERRGSEGEAPDQLMEFYHLRVMVIKSITTGGHAHSLSTRRTVPLPEGTSETLSPPIPPTICHRSQHRVP